MFFGGDHELTFTTHTAYYVCIWFLKNSKNLNRLTYKNNVKMKEHEYWNNMLSPEISCVKERNCQPTVNRFRVFKMPYTNLLMEKIAIASITLPFCSMKMCVNRNADWHQHQSCFIWCFCCDGVPEQCVSMWYLLS